MEQCARCQLPIPTPTGAVYDPPSCTLCNYQYESNKTTRIIILGMQPNYRINLKKLFTLNGFDADFCSTPATISQEFFKNEIDLILISGEVNKDLAETWAKQLRQEPELKTVPILAFSAKAGNGIPWLEEELGIEDFVLTPLNGEELAANLQRISQQDTRWPRSEVNWFPK